MYGLSIGTNLLCTSRTERLFAAVDTNPAVACRIHKLGWTKNEAHSPISSHKTGFVNNPNSVKEDIALIALAVTNSELSVRP